ncbi:unnamed protein product, partial [Prunus brigantina]
WRIHVGTTGVGRPLGRLKNWPGTPLKPPWTAAGSPHGCTPTAGRKTLRICTAQQPQILHFQFHTSSPNPLKP